MHCKNEHSERCPIKMSGFIVILPTYRLNDMHRKDQRLGSCSLIFRYRCPTARFKTRPYGGHVWL